MSIRAHREKIKTHMEKFEVELTNIDINKVKSILRESGIKYINLEGCDVVSFEYDDNLYYIRYKLLSTVSRATLVSDEGLYDINVIGLANLSIGTIVINCGSVVWVYSSEEGFNGFLDYLRLNS